MKYDRCYDKKGEIWTQTWKHGECHVKLKTEAEGVSLQGKGHQRLPKPPAPGTPSHAALRRKEHCQNLGPWIPASRTLRQSVAVLSQPVCGT